MSVLRYLRTVSYLKPQQVYGRAYFRLAKPQLARGNIPNHRTAEGRWVAPVCRHASMLSPTSVNFLNEDGEIESAKQWNDPRREKLWLYNLHYFDDLNAKGAPEREGWHCDLLKRWIDENPPGRGNGWEPYPVSLRIVNWIKWALQGRASGPAFLESLVLQARWLKPRTEWHLLGNHLLANAKALVFAGLFFEGAEAAHWLTLGLGIFRRQLPEQILSDGGHFERSPMYHAIILEDLLDLLNFSRAMGRTDIDTELALIERIKKMRRWLEAMTLGDGQIALFNDAAFGIAASPADLRDYAARLGLVDPETAAVPLTRLQPSGYIRLTAGDAIAIADVAPIGPDYLPGHAHADTLSFEFSLGTERAIVNGGTSRYGTGKERQFERSTAAHSTVEVDGENSSEVWSGFRVGRRARISDVLSESKEGISRVTASHDGYRWRPGRPVHERSWTLQTGRLIVADTVSNGPKALARFHLGTGAKARLDNSAHAGTIVLPSGREISWSSSQPARLAASQWCPEFGVSIASQQIVIPLGDGKLETVFRW